MTIMMRRATLERVLGQLLLESSPNVRVVDGLARQISLRDDGSKIVDTVQIRGNDGQSTIISDPSLVIGKWP
jgi:hypothetical protein